MNKLFEKKVLTSIEKLKVASEMSEAYYGKPLIITYSGGKDSDVLLDLAIKSNIKFEVVNSHTTLDAPQTVYHIRDTQKRLSEMGIKMDILMPYKNGERTSMWKLIEEMGCPPTRISRYCCRILKEVTIPNRLIALGVRKEESSQRKDRMDFETRGKTKKDGNKFTLEHTKAVFNDALKISKELEMDIKEENSYDCTLIKACKEQKDVMVNPIIDWTNSDIWYYISENNISYNPLYDMGYQRVGCIGCPMATYKQKCKMFKDFPKYKENYIRAFDRLLETRRRNNNPWIFKNGKECLTGEELFSWWIEEDKYGKCKDQISFIIDDDGNITL